MTHSSFFHQAIEALSPVNHILRTPKFVELCTNALTADGEKFHVGSNKKTRLPYNEPGIYLIWADFSNWGNANERPWNILLSDFLDKWDGAAENISYFPKSNRSRTKKTLQTYEQGSWIPFYLGKSEKIADRVEQHLYLEPNKRTYALKLNHRVGLLNGINFEINWLPLETTKDTYFLVTQVETILREEFMPIIGKQ